MRRIQQSNFFVKRQRGFNIYNMNLTSFQDACRISAYNLEHGLKFIHPRRIRFMLRETYKIQQLQKQPQ